MTQKSNFFQVFNLSTGRWVMYDHEQGRIVDYKKEKGPYPGIPKYSKKSE
jgi:hypothetical protein